MDPTYTLFTGESYVSPKPYKGETKYIRGEGKLSPDISNVSYDINVKEGLKIELSNDSIVAANLDVLYSIFPKVTPKRASVKYKVVELYKNSAGIEQYVNLRGGIKLSDSFSASGNYSLIYSHSTKLLDGWSLLRKLPLYGEQIVVIPLSFPLRSDALDFAYALASISVNFYASKLFTVANDNIVHLVARGININALNALQSDLRSEERFVDIEEALEIARKKRTRDLIAEKQMMIMAGTPYTLTYDIPDSFVDYITPLDFDIENIEPSVLWYVWDVPSPHPKEEYVMKGGCVRAFNKQPTKVISKVPSYNRTKQEFVVVSYITSKIDPSYRSLVIKRTLLNKWNALLTKLEVAKVILTHRLLDRNPVDDLLPSSLTPGNEARIADLQPLLLETLELKQKEVYDIVVSKEDSSVTINVSNLPVITTPLYDILEAKYRGIKKNKDLYIYNTLTNYSIVEEAGILPPVKGSVVNYLRTLYKDVTDVLSSPLNTDTREYYSLFESDVVFGSKGNPLTDINTRAILSKNGVFLVNVPAIESYSISLGRLVKRLVDSLSNWALVVVLVHGRDIASIANHCKENVTLSRYNDDQDLTVMVGYSDLALADIDKDLLSDIVKVLLPTDEEEPMEEDAYRRFILFQPSNFVRDVMQVWINEEGPSVEWIDDIADLDLFSTAKDYLEDMTEPDELPDDRSIKTRLLLFRLFPNTEKHSNTIVNVWYNKIHFKELTDPRESLISMYDQFNKYINYATEKEYRELVEAFTV